MSFENLGLTPNILKAIEKSGYKTPTPVQEEAIPAVLTGKDLKASAQTGTGKTAAFLLPILQNIQSLTNRNSKAPLALILVPTRELAMQILAEAIKFSKFLNRIKTVCLYGGVPYGIQNRELSRPYEILVATPGRLIDHIERRNIDLGNIQTFVMDEADRMLDLGFIEAVEKISSLLPNSVQTLMFSATLRGTVLKLSEKLLKDPVEVNVVPSEQNKANIKQELYFVDDLKQKLQLLEHLLQQDETTSQTIIFTATKIYAEQLVNILRDAGHRAAALHGDMNQHRRSQTIAKIKQGKIKILVATDVAARGIDVKDIGLVVNFDLPMNVEDYVHRIGRTGRAEAEGLAISFAAPKDITNLKKIEKYISLNIEKKSVDGIKISFCPDSLLNSNAQPKKRSRFNRVRSSGGKKSFGNKSNHRSQSSGSRKTFAHKN